MLPKHSITSSQERFGVNAVAEVMAKLGQIWRETSLSDVGIDGQIEYVNTDGYATGKIIAVQVKSGASFFKERDDNWLFYPEEKHRLYWENFPLPVFIVLHNPETGLSYWKNVRHSLRTVEAKDGKAILVPKANVLQEIDINTLFKDFAAAEQSFMEVSDVLKYLIDKENENPQFRITYFNIFCLGLTNICRSLYFGMDLAFNIAECKSADGISIGVREQEFLFDFIKFLVHQNIVNLDFSDCMIDWYDRKLLPIFIAPLTSRGKELIELINGLEEEYTKNGSMKEDTGHYVAQESLLRLDFGIHESQRLELVEEFQKSFNHSN